MGTVRAASVGVDSALNAYDAMNNSVPYFSLWFNQREKCFQWNGDDLEAGKEFLSDNLQAISNTGDNSLYYLRVHSKSEPVYHNKSEILCSIPIRLNPMEDNTVNGVTRTGGMPYEMYQAMAAIKDLPNTLKNQFDAINTRIDALENEPGANEPTVLDQINGVLNNQAAMNTIGMLINKFFPGVQVPPVAAQISGVTEPGKSRSILSIAKDPAKIGPIDEAVLENALDRLQHHCRIDSDLQLLANMAETNKPMFDFLLTSLRSQ
jgi:hypothetical protein